MYHEEDLRCPCAFLPVKDMPPSQRSFEQRTETTFDSSLADISVWQFRVEIVPPLKFCLKTPYVVRDVREAG